MVILQADYHGACLIGERESLASCWESTNTLIGISPCSRAGAPIYDAVATCHAQAGGFSSFRRVVMLFDVKCFVACCVVRPEFSYVTDPRLPYLRIERCWHERR
jgi:hypothetical protein